MLFCVSCCWFRLCLVGLLFRARSLFAAFAPKWKYFFEMVGFATGLKEWADLSGFPVILVACVVSIAIIGIFVVTFIVCLTLVVIVIASTISVIFSWVFLSFESTVLCTIATWYCTVVICRVGFLGFDLWCVASQYWFAIHLGPPNRLALSPFQNLTQFVCCRQPPCEPGL